MDVLEVNYYTKREGNRLILIKLVGDIGVTLASVNTKKELLTCLATARYMDRLAVHLSGTA